MKAKFIVIEGVDGSGKTTVVALLNRILKEKGFKVITTGEPTKGPIGKIIRNYIENEKERDLIIEALLFAADRRWHIKNVILPGLNKSNYVISDRYIYSSIAYQTVDSNISEEFIYMINKEVIKPDYAFFIDITPEKALKRLQRKHNIFEQIEYLNKVYKNYKKMCERGELIPIEGDKTALEIAEKILEHIL